MTQGWQAKWRPLPEKLRQGGQGDSCLAEPIDGSGGRVFIKKIRYASKIRARRRFRREVTSYELLDHPGLPRLIEDNSSAFMERGSELYLVLEYITGEDLTEWVKTNGPMSVDRAVACTTRILEIVAYCHDELVIHRDVKPQNVMLRNRDPADPVIVDFGLSFMEAPDASDDVTELDEEIGNRFLRLPEAWSNRSPVSDVTEVAGIFFYLLTGIQPHVLADQEGNAPHRRDKGREALTALDLDPIDQVRLRSVFDRAFETILTDRFQNAAELASAIAHVLAPIPDTSELEGLRAQADEIIARATRPGAEAAADRLAEFVHDASHYVFSAAEARGLDSPEQRHAYDPARFDTALKIRSAPTAPPYVQYRFEARGSQDVVLYANDEEIWAGADPDDPTLAVALEQRALRAFTEHYGEAERASA